MCIDKDPKAIGLSLYTMYNPFALVVNTSKKPYCYVVLLPSHLNLPIMISWLRLKNLHVQQVINFQNVENIMSNLLSNT